MSIQGRIGRTVGGRVKRALGVQAALEWAFRVEKAELDLPVPENRTGESYGYGLEHVLLQRAALGCRIDGGRHKIGSYTHEDAEVIAACVAGMPDAMGGRRMAIRVAELARAGLTPDWLPGAVPRCVPVEVKRNQHGERAATAVVGTARVLSRGKWRSVDILACPEDKTPVKLAEASLIEEINRRIEAGSLKNRAGNAVEKKIDGGLVREDGAYLYPVEDDIPIMLIDEAIPLKDIVSNA